MVVQRIAKAVGLIVGAALALGLSYVLVQVFALVLSGVSVPPVLAIWIVLGGWGLVGALGGLDWTLTKWEKRNG